MDKVSDILVKQFSLPDEFRDYIQDNINKSGCPNIEFLEFNNGLFGVSLHDGIILNDTLLKYPLSLCIFIILHELTHQLQFNKYGVDNMYLYLNDVSDDEVSEFILKQEIVADRLASLKIRQLQKKGLISKDFTPIQIHKKVNPELFKQKIVNYRNLMKEQNVRTPDDVSNFFKTLIIY